jgi:hypothetical protein
VGSGVHGISLAREGLHIAMRWARPAEVFSWAERCRAGALRVTPVRSPNDSRLTALLTALRVATAEHEQALLAGEAAAHLAGRQADLEHQVRDRARLAGSVTQPSVLSVPSVAAVSQRLGPGALVEIVEHETTLHAVVVCRGRATLHRLSPVAEATDLLARTRFILRRLATPGGSERTREGSRSALQRLTARLDDALLAPLRRRIGDAELVLVPTAALHSVPWSLLPTCRGRPVTLAPSASLYVRAASVRSGGDRPRSVLVAGPGLPGALAEVEAVAAALPAAEMITGERATVASVLGAMDGADLVHIAAHGRFRTDNPLFSALQLADGPLTVYDLERLAAPVHTVVLSACDTGLSAVRPGDEVMGLSACLLGMGTRVILAPVTPVDDAVAASLMQALHHGLVAGMAPAQALAHAQAEIAVTDDVAPATCAAFACFGAGLDGNAEAALG